MLKLALKITWLENYHKSDNLTLLVVKKSSVTVSRKHFLCLYGHHYADHLIFLCKHLYPINNWGELVTTSLTVCMFYFSLTETRLHVMITRTKMSCATKKVVFISVVWLVTLKL